MKKIYILAAVIALLSLSLNAQVETKAKSIFTTQNNKQTDKFAKTPSFNQILAGIKGMSSVLQAAQGPTANSGANRAPLRLNAGEELVGPFTTYDTSVSGYTGLGFPTAYGSNYQQILITTDLDRSEFADHIGDSIVGFRFALAGNTSQTAVLYDFIAWPYAGSSFDQTHQYTWDIADVAGMPEEIGDITITVGSGDVNLRSITVYGDNNSELTSWNSLTGTTTTVNLNGTNYASYDMPTGWSTPGYILRWQSTTDGYLGYMSGSPNITLSSSLFTGQSSVRVVINASTDNTDYGIYVNNEEKTLTTSLADHTWNVTASAPSYIELQAGQWHEYYLDEPVAFDLGNDITGMRMGYFYFQYPSTETNELLYPIAVNPQSTDHDHTSYMIKPNGSTYVYDDITITIPSTYSNVRSITVSSGNTTITSYSYADNSSTFPAGWSFGGTVGLRYDYSNVVSLYSSDGTGSIYISGDLFEGYSNVTVSIYFSTSTRNQTATVGVNGTNRTTTNRTGSTQTWTVNGTQTTSYSQGWWTEDFSQYGDLAVQLIFKEAKTPSPTITGQVDPNDENNYVITATGDGTVTLTVGDQTVTGSGTASITIPRTDVDQTVTATATAQDGDLEESNPTTENLTVPKLVTPSPSISITPGDAAYTITATGTGTVTLTIGEQTVTGNGTASITIPRTNVDQIITATATAQEIGKAVSEPTTENYTVPMLPITPTPEITYTQTNATVVITATGEGTVYLEAGGQTATGEGTVSITIMRSIEDQTVTASAVAVATNHQPSAQALESVPVPALTGNPATAQEGLLRMHLLIADQLKAEIPDNNSHPDRYGYVLRWEQPASVEDHKESGTVEVEIQKTEAKVNGYYTLDQIDADVNVGINHDLGLTMDVLTADASMFLPGENPDVLYYQMQGKEGENPGLGVDYLTQLQYMKNVKKYEEMLATSPNKTHQYPANETYHYFNDSEPILTGIYNDVTSFITYAPSVSTWGVQRRYFEVDHLDNTYGAPIWKTAVGQVKLNSAVHERQKNQWNSVNWKDEGGNDCSLYILDNIEAEGYLPHTGISNVEYEPYMFRVFVESKNGKLRPYTVVPQGDGDHDGEHLVAGTGTTTGPICVWSGYYMDGDVNGMTFSGPRASETVSGQMKYVFTKVKVDRSTDNVVNPWDDLSDPWNDFDTITDPETGAIIKIIDTNRGKANAMFGALDNLAEIIGTDDQGKPIYAPVSEDDLKVFVRFYYVAAGTADGHVPDSRAGGATYPAGYGTESPGKAPSPWTIVNELRYHGEIVSQTYVNAMGMQSDRPFDGVNIVITRYSDGTTSTTKVLR